MIITSSTSTITQNLPTARAVLLTLLTLPSSPSSNPPPGPTSPPPPSLPSILSPAHLSCSSFFRLLPLPPSFLVSLRPPILEILTDHLAREKYIPANHSAYFSILRLRTCHVAPRNGVRITNFVLREEILAGHRA